MATNSSPLQCESKELFRHGDGDGEEDEDGDEMLDPRVKGELDRLNSSTAEINRLEQDLEELQAAFRQTLTESAFVLKRQASFLGKSCVDNARPYYDAMRRAKQAQIETQRAALKYEKAGTSHKAAKELLATAEQKMVSTSKEHKILDPKWQEMLNQAVLRVTEAERERALSEREHLETARVFSAAGSKVTELRTKLKSVINKSRPYFELKMKYDQILEAHKRQVENIQEGLQVAKQEYSLALRNLEGISEEIHEMRRSRDSLDTIFREREEGVGAESPSVELSCESLRGDSGIQNPATSSERLDKPTYGFKIALVSASRNVVTRAVQVESEDVTPVTEREGDPEGFNSLDTDQLCMDSRPTELDGSSWTSSGREDNYPDDTTDDTGGNSITSNVHGDGSINGLDNEVDILHGQDVCLSDNSESSPLRGCLSSSDANSAATAATSQDNTTLDNEDEVDDDNSDGCPVEATTNETSDTTCCIHEDVNTIKNEQHEEATINLDIIGCTVDTTSNKINERTCCIQEDENKINSKQPEKPTVTVNLDVKDCPAEATKNEANESTCCIQDDENKILTGERNEKPAVNLESNCLRPDAEQEFSTEIDKGIVSASSVTDSEMRNETDVSVNVLNTEDGDSTGNKEETENNQATGQEDIN